MKLTVISGRSGSGKSTALHVLEDAGFNCIDNLPVGLLPGLVANARSGTSACAVSIDARNLPHDLIRFPEILADLRRTTGLDVEIIYLDAELTTLVRRFSETRRRHPLTGNQTTLPEALVAESRLLEPIASRADLVVDTTQLSHHELRQLIRTRVAERRQGSGHGIALTLMSFGYANGIPVDADLVFDVRCLPNPHWIEDLRAQSGLDGPVKAWLGEQPEVDAMAGDVQQFLERWLPAYAHSNRSYMTIAIGCTGGKHRSVYLCERLAARFKPEHPDVLVRHRDLS